MGKIVLFGATGYTGELVARSLVGAGARPVLAGRSEAKLAGLSSQLGGLDTARADASDPQGVVTDLLDEADVLVTTVGPFSRYGEPAVRAAISAGAGYLDSTGEPSFIRKVFEVWGLEAQGRAALVTGFGYDYVPGNLAGALALEEAGDAATRIDVGYFTTGGGDVTESSSTGTAASAIHIAFSESFSWRDGRIVTERPAAHVRSFTVEGRHLQGFTVGGTEHYGLPRVSAQVRDVGVYVGWFGPRTRLLSGFSRALEPVRRVPGARSLTSLASGLVARRSGRGPSQEFREQTGSHIVAVASDRDGNSLAEVHLAGPNPYTFTGDILAWGARHALGKGVEGSGALGPVEAFGLEGLQRGCAEAGMQRV